MTALTSRLAAALGEISTRGEPLLFEGQAFSGADLERMAAAYAQWLLARGLRSGDRVAIRAENSPLYLACLLAHLRLGLVHLPISTKYTASETAYVTENAQAACLVEPSELAQLANATSDWCWPDLPSGEALALLIYTSGTTGKPKGVKLSHRGLYANLSAMGRLWEVGPSDTVLVSLPLFHVHGLGLGVLMSWLQGARVHLLSRFRVDAVVRAFADGQASVFMGVPTMYHQLLAHLESAPDSAEALRAARLFTSGSAALSAADFARFEALTGHRILERYGMSETGFTVSNPLHGERRPGTVGQPVPGWELRLVDEQGQACQEGELEVRGEALMEGYWGLSPEQMAPNFREGWFRTGDTARWDEGYLVLVGRTSTDIIKSGGFKIGAREIEEVLMASGCLREVAVLGLPDAKWGEVVAVAFVSEQAPEQVRASLEAQACAHLADYKRPRRYLAVAELPRNALGKVQKSLLKPRFEAIEARGGSGIQEGAR